MSDNFDPRDHIDRNAEQELFRDLVSFTSPARMLTICDKGARGKSSLLKRLKYNCKYEIKPPVPACMIALDQLKTPSSFELISTIYEELKDVSFPKYIDLNNARIANNFTPFDKSTYMLASTITVGGDVGPEAMIVSKYTNFEKADINKLVVSSINTPFNNEQQKFAQDRCIEAFFDDLRVICATKPIVILLDAWDRCNSELRNWITDELLAKHCFNRDKNLRPANLAIVLASRLHSKEERYGLRDNEFMHLFVDKQEYATVVLSRTSLSDWDSDHVRAFLDQHGITNLDDDDIDYIRDSLKKGRTFYQLLSVATALTAQ